MKLIFSCLLILSWPGTEKLRAIETSPANKPSHEVFEKRVPESPDAAGCSAPPLGNLGNTPAGGDGHGRTLAALLGRDYVVLEIVWGDPKYP